MITKLNNHTHQPPLKKMARSLFIAIITMILGSISTAYAQDKTLTLDEAIKLGLDNSKVLKLVKIKN